MKIQVFGLGGAGLQMIGSIKPTDSVQVVGWDADERALKHCSLKEKRWIGADLLRGWGVRGDKSVGAQVFRLHEQEMKNEIKTSAIVFLAASLGGGLGAGGLASVVSWVKEKGALPIILVSMPFQWEGVRNVNQAMQTLQELRKTGETVFIFPADQLTKEGWAEGERADQKWHAVIEAMGQCLNGLIEMITKKGLVFSETEEVLKAITTISHGASLQGGFGWGEGKGAHAMDEALATVIANDWLRDAATSAHEVLVAVLGGPKLALAEVKKATEFLKQHVGNENTHFIFNAILEESYEGKVKLVIWTAGVKGGDELAVNVQEVADESKISLPLEESASLKEKELKQEAFAFETPNRGRFEKTDATFYQGENLDIPTFLRKQIRIRQVSV
ncbi:MAG: hypothetical protein K1X66_07270 [Verrucomicrobiae bacterium]|nr:hypothetical protein [Verrucomicrobiae bacterium]